MWSGSSDEALLASIPRKYRGLYRRAIKGNDWPAAVRAHCLMCCGWDAAEVERCTGTATRCSITAGAGRRFVRMVRCAQALSNCLLS